jgi:protein gp37
MADHTAIEWTDATWNPVTGCDRVSPGCAHCYALDLAGRLKRMGNKRYQVDGDPKSSGPGFGVTLHEDVLESPLRWRRPRRIFVNSMSDLFHEAVPDEFIVEVFNVMAKAGRHVFQVLTKRPERMQKLLAGAAPCEHGGLTHNGDNPTSYGGTGLILNDHRGWPLPNIWLGVSIENRRFVHRADLLRETPAAVRFISAEPLLGPLVLDGVAPDPEGGVIRHWKNHKPQFYNPPLDLTDIDWLIVGGESGPKHRPIRVEWVRGLLDAALETRPGWEKWSRPDAAPAPAPSPDGGTAFFFKQWGGRTSKEGGRELDGRTWDEMPEGGRRQ